MKKNIEILISQLEDKSETGVAGRGESLQAVYQAYRIYSLLTEEGYSCEDVVDIADILKKVAQIDLKA